MSGMKDIEDLVATNNFSKKDVDMIRSQLHSWYKLNRREMPWRGDVCDENCTSVGTVNVEHQPSNLNGTISPYETWISEVMLQQTRVATVIEYYRNWMKHFPTVEALATATPDQVNSQWAGLGYYSRARNLHKGAKMIVEKWNGKFPSTNTELKSIPGVGAYTAGAISSLAFGNSDPVVDGNVIRVFARLRAIALTKKDPMMHKLCWRLAAELVPPPAVASRKLEEQEVYQERGSNNYMNIPGVFNQALMELGATICTPKVAQCEICPLQNVCKAKIIADSSTSGDISSLKVTRFPLPVKKKPPKDVCRAICVIQATSTGRVLAQQRPPTGLLAGQWEPFPSLDLDKIELQPPPNITVRRAATMNQIKKVFGDVFHNEDNATDLGVVVHTFSHRRHHMSVEKISISEEIPLSEKINSSSGDISANVKWMSMNDLIDVGVTTCARKAFTFAGIKIGGVKRKNKKKTKDSKRPRVATKKITSFFSTTTPACD